MNIAIAAGKGGTGKTTVAVNLARVLDGPVQLLDCDVEEPNCHLFVGQTNLSRREVTIPVPAVDSEACDGCGECARLCEFGAIAALPNSTLVFPELCHGCGGCLKVCPRGAIREVERRIGVVETLQDGSLTLIHGRLDIGAAMAPPLIRAVRKEASGSGPHIIDGPPGTSCPLVACVRDCDYTVLVSEPTPFGLHDLTLAIDTLRSIGIPFGVVINRADIGDSRVKSYCAEQGIPVLLELPEDTRVAAACSEGKVIVDCIPEYVEPFRRLRDELFSRMPSEAVAPQSVGLERELEEWEHRLARFEGSTRETGGAG